VFRLTLLLHKDPDELTGCLYKEMVYCFLMILFKVTIGAIQRIALIEGLSLNWQMFNDFEGRI
jgi:hypothetical protein